MMTAKRMTTAKPLRVLLLAEACNPDWPSLPLVGYKAVRAIACQVDATIVTHVRNRRAITAHHQLRNVHYLDTEFIARPMYKLSNVLRGDARVGWSTAMAMVYPSYLAFEFAAWKRFKTDLLAGRFDLVHRVTPMSPTLPSPLAARSPVPFVLGPLNGGLKWPAAFRSHRHREREWLTYVRRAHKCLPYWRSTYTRSAAVLAGFEHTMAEVRHLCADRLINFPEVGYDPQVFYPPSSRDLSDPVTILFVGRLVPYKCPDVLVQCFAESSVLRRHRLWVVGDGPERPHLQGLIHKNNLAHCVQLLGSRKQAEVAEIMRRADVFGFPSIRELGAGVVVEAMASGLACVVVDYGGPGALIDSIRGIRVPLASKSDLVIGFTRQIELLVTDSDRVAALGEAAAAYAAANFAWAAKAKRTVDVYRWVVGLRPDKPTGY